LETFADTADRQLAAAAEEQQHQHLVAGESEVERLERGLDRSEDQLLGTHDRRDDRHARLGVVPPVSPPVVAGHFDRIPLGHSQDIRCTTNTGLGLGGWRYVVAMTDRGIEVRFATSEDAPEVARLLHDFNVEFDTPTPGPDVLAARLRVLLASRTTLAILAGTPAVGVALVTLRTNVWYDGSVALLDELYVAPVLRDQGVGSAIMAMLLDHARRSGVDLIEINVDEGDVDAQRFYVRHGFDSTEPTTDERAFYFFQEL
jgi:GNAT superfamily N-acetyltransferase